MYLGVHVKTVVYDSLPENLLGFYDQSTNVIHVNKSLDRRQRHYTAVHERFHKTLNHGPSSRPGVRASREILVEGMTAQYMIPFRALLDAFTSCSDAQGMAAFLNVDCELVYARIMNLSNLERLMIQVCGIRCVGINLSAPHPDGALAA